jgi:HD-like signal output (HDOD) protein
LAVRLASLDRDGAALGKIAGLIFPEIRSTIVHMSAELSRGMCRRIGALEISIQVSRRITEVTDLWLDGAAPSESDLRIASSLVARLAGTEGVRPFSSVVARLVDSVSRPDFELVEVCKLIELDLALASRVLRVANSAAYKGQDPCASVTQAVVRIGATNIAGLAMAMSAMAMFQDLGGIARRIRDHSTGTAVVARELALSLSCAPLAPKVFLTGLLHDIGKLLIIQSGDKAYAELVARERVPSSIHHSEVSMLGFDHGLFGACVLKSWNIPAPSPQLIAWHHQPKGACGATAWARALDLLRLADVIDWLLGQGCQASSPWVARLALSPDGVRAGLSTDTLPSLWNDLRTVRTEALEIFT